MSERVAVTTIVRSAGLEQAAGWLRVLSLDTGEQLAMSPLPDALHRALDTNPRGGLRGGRGVASTDDRLAVAINDRILVLDRDWQLARVLSHPWMGGIHDIAANPAGLWVTCSDNDLVLHVDWDGHATASWHWRKDRAFRRELGFGWLPAFDRSIDHRNPLGGGLRVDLGHVNAVAAEGDRLLVLLGMVRPPVRLAGPAARARASRLADRAGLGDVAAAATRRWRTSRGAGLGARLLAPDLGDVEPGTPPLFTGREVGPGWSWAAAEVTEANHGRPRARVVARHPTGGAPAHNVLAAEDMLVVNDSASGRVLGVDGETGAIVHAVQLPGELPFPRGLVALGDGRFLVGTQWPVALHVVDLPSERIVQRMPLSDDRNESAYAIAPVPAGFRDPAQLPQTRAGWEIPGADASGRADVRVPLPTS